MKILPFDDSLWDNRNKTAYILDHSNYSPITFKPKKDPVENWAIPFVTGHKYKVHWSYGLDWTQMKVELSAHWNSSDKPIHFVHNFTDKRVKFDVTVDGE